MVPNIKNMEKLTITVILKIIDSNRSEINYAFWILIKVKLAKVGKRLIQQHFPRKRMQH